MPFVTAPDQSLDKTDSLAAQGHARSTTRRSIHQHGASGLSARRRSSTPRAPGGAASRPRVPSAIGDTAAACMTVDSVGGRGSLRTSCCPAAEERSTTVKKRPSREPEHAGWALTPASAGAPGHEQHTTNRSSADTVDGDVGFPSRHRRRDTRACAPTTCPRAQPGHRGEWAPPKSPTRTDGRGWLQPPPDDQTER